MPSTQAIDHQSYRPRFCRICKLPSHPTWRYWIGHNVQVVMNGFPPIPHILWVHGQDLTILEHNQYDRIPSIQKQHNTQICKTTMPSSWWWWWCVLLYETTGHRYVTTHSIYCVGTLKRSDKPGIQSIHQDVIQPSHRAPKLWDQICQDMRNNHAILGVMYIGR